jgi:proteasome lid subunit RPN8/RPN11
VSDLTIPGGPYVAPGVREKICNHVFSSLEAEVGGVLIGHLREDGSPLVSDIIPALEADGARARVTFTHDAWAQIHHALDLDHPGKEILGWYHSHPGFGIFLSDHDLFIHRNFFSRPEQVAIVVDPHVGLEGVFVWRSGEIVKQAEGETLRPAERPKAIERVYQPPRSRLEMTAYWAIGMVIGALLWSWLLQSSNEAHWHRAAAAAKSAKGKER